MMTPEGMKILKQVLKKHEGYSRFPYLDTVGNITIGCGYNLTDRGLPDDFLNKQCDEDIQFFYNSLTEFSWFRNLDEARQLALLDMCFMGFKKFMTFKKMIAALEKKDFEEAAKEVLNSKWAIDVKEIRANDIANIIRTGIIKI